ncbi:NDR1/HIN1-like protein 26 [Ziziphus jujuba]|uniref:NDR1/HIN1-like protein 26 n=2 Tax=Ziziphus jujuba TaxID=326968 RepID=A0A6P3Z6V9_ZIZJJ|nr:NDR1/HIN1-like protein 26 [Ziziphus jujuba]KAH7542081.1 hypothetical protein FEM48_Zijuj02G0035500 [Ziziphus jujuba var. spinosa]
MASSSKSKPLTDHKEEDQAAKKSEKKQLPSQARYIAFLVLAIIVVMSLAMGIIWAVVKPKRPKIVVENGYFINSTISHGNTTLSGWLLFEVNFYNPNKKATIYYDTLNASSSFSDTTKNVESLNAGFNTTPHGSCAINYSYKADFWSMYGHMPKYRSHGHIIQSILFYGKIRFRFGNWKSQPRAIKVYCSNLVVFTRHTFKPTLCTVDY